MTSTSTGPRVDSGRRPSCSGSAVKSDEPARPPFYLETADLIRELHQSRSLRFVPGGASVAAQRMPATGECGAESGAVGMVLERELDQRRWAAAPAGDRLKRYVER
jgi:hypothetical protein